MNILSIQLDILDYVVIGVYFVGILASGMWFGRYTKSTKDFFLGGQKFSWWLVAISCVATLVGSYSFINYAELGRNSGLSAVTYYTNDWFILPIFMLAWLPIIYFSRVISIPEYFGRRFDTRTRLAALFIIMIYLIGYIGINLYTIGTAFRGIFGGGEHDSLILYGSAIGVAVFSILYMHHGGQTSVIMTDLLQGFILLAAGFIVLGLGLIHIGGFTSLWEALPQSHRLPFPDYNNPPAFHAVGAFWSDAITGSLAFYCMNQGVLMRFMSVRSVKDGKKAICFVVLVFMPIAAIAVSNAGWLGTAMVNGGEIEKSVPGKDIFVTVASIVCMPGIFGLVISALIAALMSTLDTLINAVSAIAVNDIWRPYINPGQDDKYYLRMARYFALFATAAGVFLVPVYSQFSMISEAFSHFISLMTPPMIVVIVLAILWKRFTSTAAFVTLILGFALTLLSAFFPWLVSLVDHGVAEAYRAADGFDPSKHSYYPSYSHMRALFGTIVSLSIAFGVTLFTKNKEEEEISGLTICSIDDAKRNYKGSEVNEENAGAVKLTMSVEFADISEARLSQDDMDALSAKPGDLLFISDTRFWLGGLRSIQLKAGDPHDKKSVILFSEKCAEQGSLIKNASVVVEKLL